MATNKPNGATPRYAYPQSTLAKTLESIGRPIAELGGANGDVQRSLIAQSMGVDDDSANLTLQLTAARLYNIVDGRGAYRLTDTAKQYFYPSNESDLAIAKLKMAASPPLFNALVARFNGTRLPTTEQLVNILHRDFAIPESWRTRTASMFVGAMRFAGAVDSVGFLRFKASLEGAGASRIPQMNHVPEQPPEEAEVDQQPPPAPPNEINVAPGIVNSWSFGFGDELVRVQTSQNLSMELWEKLEQYVRVLKPVNKDPAAPGS